jgi:hypothetical protein
MVTLILTGTIIILLIGLAIIECKASKVTNLTTTEIQSRRLNKK